MRAQRLALAILASLPFAALAQQVKDVDVVWVGTYRIAETKPVEDPTAPTGYRYVASGIEPVSQTQRIPAVVGTRFDIAYVLKGEPEGTVVPVQAFWRFQHPWELVPGKWTIEIWVEGAPVLETSFDLYIP